MLLLSDPFAAVFGNETFVGGFADFSSLAKVRINAMQTETQDY